jgi:ABC-2 type transport system ATP-binding protein
MTKTARNGLTLAAVFLSSLLIVLLTSLLYKAFSFSLYEALVWVLFAALSALLFFLPRWVKKEYPSKTFRMKSLTHFFAEFSKPETRVLLYRKALAFFLFILFLTRFYDTDADYLQNVVSCQSDFMAPWEVGVGAILSNWWIGALLFLLIAEFHPTLVFQTVERFLCGPIVFLCLCFFPQIAQGIDGNIAASPFSVRALFMALELGTMLAFVFDRWRRDPSLRIDKETGYALLVSAILIFLATINDYLPMNLFGEHIGSLSSPMKFNLAHRIWIYLCFLLPVLYYVLLYPFDKEHRKAFLFFLAAAVFFSYAAVRRRQTFLHIENAPLHLCNTAMYIMPFTLVFSNYFLFYFTMFVNVIGAFLAMLMPNYASTIPILSSNAMEFFINHLYATFMPILIILLGIYERPKMKYFLYSMIGFLGYFILVAFLDIYYDGVASLGLDFFFLNSDFISDKLGSWALNIFHQTVKIESGGHTFLFRPLYLTLFYLIYVGLSFVMWYVYDVLFLALDELALLRVRETERKKGREAYLLSQKEEGVMRESKERTERKASLVLSQVSKTYPGSKEEAIQDVSLSLEGGKIYGFLGKNGAGKSTLIKAIVGIHSFDKGSISVCGFDIRNEPIDAKLCLGYVPDSYALYENLTGRQYIHYIATIYRVGKREMEERSEALVRKLELTDAYDQPIRSYSHGMKQKITIIGALVHEPKIWILDEPMTGLDPSSIYQIKETMRDYAHQGNLVFFSSHIIDVVENLCDEIIIIRKGRIIEQKPRKEYEEEHIDLEQRFLTITADSDTEAKLLIRQEENERKC